MEWCGQWGGVLGAHFPGGAGGHFVTQRGKVELLEGLHVHNLNKQFAPKTALLDLFIRTAILVLAEPPKKKNIG
jgi:hypothetical protein